VASIRGSLQRWTSRRWPMRTTRITSSLRCHS
jgi:hypothetical protein